MASNDWSMWTFKIRHQDCLTKSGNNPSTRSIQGCLSKETKKQAQNMSQILSMLSIKPNKDE